VEAQKDKDIPQEMRRHMQWFTTPVIGAQSPNEIAQIISDTSFNEESLVAREDGSKKSAPVTKGVRRPVIKSHPHIDQFTGFESRYPAESRRFPWPQPKLWMHTCHTFGYIPPTSGRLTLPIKPLSSIHSDTWLRRRRVNITLDRLRVRSYPGSGIHRILLHFYAQNQTPEQVEELHYNTVYRVREGEEAALSTNNKVLD
jgi:hypothetical protein